MIKKQTPVDSEVVKEKIDGSGLRDLGLASIREIVKLVNQIERATGIRYIRMEMGVPGLLPPSIGIEAEIEALKNGVASTYPNIEGLRSLKEETSRFVKLFLNVDVQSKGCIPTVGSMMGGMISFLVANRNDHTKEGTLFIDPGFPVQKQQAKMLGHSYYSFDVYDYRGSKLKDKLESYLVGGKISSILYSNPNNPSWICFTEKELKIIAELADKYDVVVLEDLAYVAMDFRKDLYHPGKPPYQATAARYTDNYILFISSSKAFSYAGQRIGLMIMSDMLYEKKCPDLKRHYTTDIFGRAMIFGTVYALSAGVTHSAQYAVAAMLKAANDNKFNFVDIVKEYGEKAKIMKKLFVDNGFYIVYDKDENDPIADGFYFTYAYPGFSGQKLLEEMIYYGISAISLAITGSERLEGIRACVSLVQREQFPELEKRLNKFHQDHPIK
jgi:aspartate/methionine/tyrosine aminotransferase